MLAGFAVEGFVISAILVQMVPLLTVVGLDASGVCSWQLFSGRRRSRARLINMLFGSSLRQTWLALGATGTLALGLAELLLTIPSPFGAVIFAILLGLGSGLMSIVGGTLPLEIFGSNGYGTRVGWITAARQFSSALAPFGFASMAASLGVVPALWVIAAIGMAGIAAFAGIAALQARVQKGRLGAQNRNRAGDGDPIQLTDCRPSKDLLTPHLARRNRPKHSPLPRRRRSTSQLGGAPMVICWLAFPCCCSWMRLRGRFTA